MLGTKLDEHGAAVWLVNTGWTGGPFGEGERMPIAATRAMLSAALSGELAGAKFRVDEVFGFEVPVAVPGVASQLLDPRSTWSDPAVYDAKARELAGDVPGQLRALRRPGARRRRAAALTQGLLGLR